MTSGERNPLSKWHVLALAVTCAALIANLYFVQPIAQEVTTSLGMPLQQAGLLTTLPLLGYGVGLLMIVPLGDMVENRRLILIMIAAEALSMFMLWWAPNAALFLFVSFVAGLAATAIQVILPYTSQFFSGAEQGRAVGRLVSGVMLGIMVARPFSSFTAELLPWRAVYLVAALLMAALNVILLPLLPPRRPGTRQNYPELLHSMGGILRQSTVVRRRTTYQAAMFAAFISFWTAAPLWLAGSPFNLSQSGIAWVALAGVAGAFAPPIATRLVDAGYSKAATAGALTLAILAFVVTLAAQSGGVALVVVAAVVLDTAAAGSLVIGQRAIYALDANLRGRMNALFMGIFFSAGSLASASAAWLFVHFGWLGAALQGMILPACALVYCLTDRTGARPGTNGRAS